MTQIIVVFHSGYGHTLRMAQAVAQGADAEMLVIDADGNLPEGGWDSLAQAKAIIFGSPTYMGNVSWQFKRFADASSKPWYAQAWKDKLAAGFTNSAGLNGDKLSTLHAMFTRGLVDETRGLLDRSLAENRTALQAIGYRQVVEHLRGERALAGTIELVKIRTRQFAKRQMTWFRRQPVTWLPLQPGDTAPAIAARLAATMTDR